MFLSVLLLNGVFLLHVDKQCGRPSNHRRAAVTHSRHRVDRIDRLATGAGVLDDDREPHHRVIWVLQAHVNERRVPHRTIIERHRTPGGNYRRTHVLRRARYVAASNGPILGHRIGDPRMYEIRRNCGCTPQNNEPQSRLVAHADRTILDLPWLPFLEVAVEVHALSRGRGVVELPPVRLVQDFVHTIEGFSLRWVAAKREKRQAKHWNHTHGKVLSYVSY